MNKKQATQGISKTEEKQTKNITPSIKKFNTHSQPQDLSNNPQHLYAAQKTPISNNNSTKFFTHFNSNQGLPQTNSKNKGEIQESLVRQIYSNPHQDLQVRLADDDDNDFKGLLSALSTVKAPERSQANNIKGNAKISILPQSSENFQKQSQNFMSQKLASMSKKQDVNANRLKGSVFNLSDNEIKWFMIGTFVIEKLELLTCQQISWTVESLKTNRPITSENRRAVLSFIQQIIKEIDNLELIPLKLKNFYYSMSACRLFESMKEFNDQNILQGVIEYGRKNNEHFTETKRKIVCSVAQVYLSSDYVHKQAKQILIRNLIKVLSLYMEFKTKKVQIAKQQRTAVPRRSSKVQQSFDKSLNVVEFKEKGFHNFLNPFEDSVSSMKRLHGSQQGKEETNKFQDYSKLTISSAKSSLNVQERSEISKKEVSKSERSDYSSDSDSESESESESQSDSGEYETFLKNQAHLNTSFIQKKRQENIQRIAEHKKVAQNQCKKQIEIFFPKGKVEKIQSPQVLLKSSAVTVSNAQNSQLHIKYQELGKFIKSKLTTQFSSFLNQVFRDYSDTKTSKDSNNFNVKTRRSVLDFIGNISEIVKQTHEKQRKIQGQLQINSGDAKLGKQVSRYLDQNSLSRILQIRTKHNANYFPVAARKQIFAYIKEVMSLKSNNV